MSTLDLSMLWIIFCEDFCYTDPSIICWILAVFVFL
jgi:hypothetical protein